MTAIDADALRRFPLPPATGGKDERGRVVVVGGARGTVGAAALAGLAALRVGAGRLTLLVEEPVAAVAAGAVPEAGVLAWTGADGCDEAALDELGQAHAVLVGPGLSSPDHSRLLLRQVVAATRAPLVLDAFALGVLPDLPQVARDVRGRAVLTPNGTEIARLLGQDGQDGQDDEKGETDGSADDGPAEVARRYAAVVTARSQVVDEDGRTWVGDARTPGLGTSGSGDVLAGAVVGLLAAGMDRAGAAVWGVALHTAAGAQLADEVGPVGYLARELVDVLPRARRRLAST